VAQSVRFLMLAPPLDVLTEQANQL
jgi:hypothetical protein